MCLLNQDPRSLRLRSLYQGFHQSSRMSSISRQRAPCRWKGNDTASEYADGHSRGRRTISHCGGALCSSTLTSSCQTVAATATEPRTAHLDLITWRSSTVTSRPSAWALALRSAQKHYNRPLAIPFSAMVDLPLPPRTRRSERQAARPEACRTDREDTPATPHCAMPDL